MFTGTNAFIAAAAAMLVLPARAAGLAAAAGSSPAGLHFVRVGSEGGPPPEVVTAVYQDRAGFLWIGSRDGLFRYDGHAFSTFEHRLDDPASISDHVIRTLFEDRTGTLWIGTNAGGLSRLDRGRWTFESFRHDPADPRSLSYDSVYAIVQDRDGALWVATQHGLNRFDPDAGTCERFFADPAAPGSIGGDYVTALLADSAGRLWAGTAGGGLSIRDPASGRFRTFRHDPRDPRSLPSDSVFALVEEPGGGIWIGTQAGLARWREEDQGFEAYGPDRSGAASPLFVTCLAAGPAGRLWIGTLGDGLHELDVATGRFRSSRHDPSRPNSLGSDRVLATTLDRGGGLWVGSWGGGLQRVAPSALVLAGRADPARVAPSGEDIGALAPGRDGGLWIGTMSGVLLRHARGRAEATAFPVAPGDALGQVLALLEDRRGRIWVGTSLGLRRVELATGKTATFLHDAADPASLGPGYVRALVEDAGGAVWVGTGEGGVQRLGEDGRVVARFLHEPDDPLSLSDDYVVALAEDRRGTLWIGTRSGGLNALEPASGRISRYPATGEPGSLGHRTVTAIVEDDRDRLWVGTSGGGLHRVQRDGAGAVSFQRFTEAEGLVDNDVMAILPDDDGSLWLSTRRGLSRFDPGGLAVANYRASDGLPTGEFEVGAAARAGATLFFGGVRGLVAVPAGTPFPAAVRAPTVLTSIRTSAGEVRGARPVWELDRIDVPYGERLAFELAVLDFGPAERHRYAYRLGSDDEPWIDLGPQRGVTFTDLPPGTHRFAARGRGDQGGWTDATRALEVRVVPPFWMTLPFRFLVVLAIAATAFGAHHARTAALERRNRELVELQRQREKVQEELRGAYGRLRLLTRRLEAAREDERRHVARELHDDLGPAVTAVAINLQLLAQGGDPRKNARRLADSTELVDRMAQRIRDLSLGLRPPLLDEMGLVPALKGYLENEAERTGLAIEVHGDAAIDGLPPEIEITAFRVAQEAVTNVVRHARARRVSVSIERRHRRLEIVVEDDGVGFDVRATMEGAATGKALGLLGMQERVQILGGRFEVGSAPGRGTKVAASLPLEGGA
jgi:ligand-binding sensor domain-containing protein/signal transduction histidine kinase